MDGGEGRGVGGACVGREKWMHSLMASIHLGSQSVIGVFVHEVRKCVEGERGERKATEVVHFEM